MARPYAEAIYRIAREVDKVDDWALALQALARVANVARVAELINNPRLSNEQLTRTIADICSSIVNHSLSLPAEVYNFLLVLADNDRLELLPEIYQLFDEQRVAAQGVAVAMIETAFELEPEQVLQLKQRLDRHFDSKLNLNVTTNPELIGGILVTVGDKVLDLSVRGSLESMSKTLRN